MKYQRQMDLLQYINEVGTATIGQLLEHFPVSKATLNRDLTALEKENSIKKVHGGVVSNIEFQTYELPINQKELFHKQEKEWIAREAIKRITSNQTILLDSGSTVWYLAKELAAREDLENLTVVTCDLKTAYTLSDNENISLYVLGGMKQKAAYDLYEPNMLETLSALNVDAYYMAGAAFDWKAGVTHTDQTDTIVKAAMMECAREVILCSDSSKYGIVKRWSLCGLEQLSAIITDDSIGDENKKQICSVCKNVIIVKSSLT